MDGHLEAKKAGTDALGPSGAPVGVDVLMIAYNMEPFIEQAIAGVLAQRTEFPVRVIIADDRSTDRTLEICKRLGDEYPGVIRIVPGEVNLGIAGRTAAGLEHCRAKYLAICDSDDIWTDPDKLALQVDYLEDHPECGLCYTDVRVITRQGEAVEPDGLDGLRADFAEGDVFVKLLMGNFICNSTVVVRRDLLSDLIPPVDRTIWIQDLLMWLHVSLRSSVHYIPRKTVAYRQGGVTSRANVHNHNKELLEQRMASLLRTFGSLQRPVTEEDRPVLLRKVAGTLLRSTIDLRAKARLIPVLFQYLPNTISGWRDLLIGGRARYRITLPIDPSVP